MTMINHKLKREGCLSMFSKGKRRPIIIELSPPGDVIGLRLKGERTTYYLPIDWCYRTAVEARVREVRRLKREAKNPPKSASKFPGLKY